MALTGAEQDFVKLYIGCGHDAIKAVTGVYKVTSEESAQARASQLLRKPEVIVAIAEAEGRDALTEQELWGHLVAAILQNQSPTLKLGALKLAFELKGMTGRSKPGRASKMATDGDKDVLQALTDRVSTMPLGRLLEATKGLEDDNGHNQVQQG